MAKLTAAAPMDDYQAQDDMRTLTRAEEIKADAKRHQKAMAHGKQAMAAMKAVVQPDGDDVPGKKEPGEGSKAEEAKDAKMAKKAPMSMKGLRVAQRTPKVNRSQVI